MRDFINDRFRRHPQCDTSPPPRSKIRQYSPYCLLPKQFSILKFVRRRLFQHFSPNYKTSRLSPASVGDLSNIAATTQKVNLLILFRVSLILRSYLHCTQKYVIINILENDKGVRNYQWEKMNYKSLRLSLKSGNLRILFRQSESLILLAVRVQYRFIHYEYRSGTVNSNMVNSKFRFI